MVCCIIGSSFVCRVAQEEGHVLSPAARGAPSLPYPAPTPSPSPPLPHWDASPSNMQCRAFDDASVAAYRTGLALCFRRAVELNMGISIVPHLDDGSGWGLCTSMGMERAIACTVKGGRSFGGRVIVCSTWTLCGEPRGGGGAVEEGGAGALDRPARGGGGAACTPCSLGVLLE